jgi:DNA-binding IclR family transcriptional regulator
MLEIARPAAYPIGSVEKALRLLLLLGARPALRVSDAASELEIARSSAHRLLTTLEQYSFARQDEATRAYVAGPALAELAYASAGRELRRLVRPHLEQLSHELGETVHLVTLEGASARFVESVECSRALRVGSRAGVAMPAHCTSAGKALLAQLTDAELRELLDAETPLVQMTPRSAATLDELTIELDAIRERGYATNVGESEDGIAAAAAATRFTPYGYRAAISVSAPSSRVDELRLAELGVVVARAAASVFQVQRD